MNTDLLERLRGIVEEARRERSGADLASGAAAILCAYVPRELVECFYPDAYRLVPEGTAAAEAEGEKRSGPYVCSYCKAFLGGERSAVPMIGCSSCDQMRRALELDGRRRGREERRGEAEGMAVESGSLIINMPATRSENARDYYASEVRWLAGALSRETGKACDEERLRAIVMRRNAVRRKMRDVRRGLRGSEMAALVHCEFLLGAEKMSGLLESLEVERRASEPKPALKLILAGSPVTFEEIPLLEFIESRGASIVADATCTGDRAIDFEVEVSGDMTRNLARAYFERPPCIWVRPNDDFYDWAAEMVREREVEGVIWKTVRNCDVWNLEFQRAREILGLPILSLEPGYADIVSTRTKTQIEAFVENLGGKRG